jgi:hypothetical protein
MLESVSRRSAFWCGGENVNSLSGKIIWPRGAKPWGRFGIALFGRRNGRTDACSFHASLMCIKYQYTGERAKIIHTHARRYTSGRKEFTMRC